MELLHLIILSIIQGLTEFLPVSSSAHLILLPLLMEWEDQGLALDVAAHLGSLFAVLVYFRRQLSRIIDAGISAITRGQHSTDSSLFWYIAVASAPTLIIGFFARDSVSTHLRDPLLIATTSICFGFLLWFADRAGKKNRSLTVIGWLDIFIIGLMQAFALIPGTSRSGITITAGLLLGLDRQHAARFSFLLAIPIILAAAAFELLGLITRSVNIDILDFLIVMALSSVSAILAIHCFLSLLDRIGMLPFVLYRIVLGCVLILFFF